MPDIQASAYPITIDGVEYWCSPLSDLDMSELDNWVRSQTIQDAERAMTPDMTPEARRDLRTAALEVAGSISWMQGPGARRMATVDGLSRILWHMIKKRHPEVTHEVVRRWCVNPKHAGEAERLFRELNIPKDRIKKGVTTKDRRRAKKRQRSQRKRPT